MLSYFRRIATRAEELGNHRRKYLHGIERWGQLLIDRLEESGRFDRVHLRRRAQDVSYEMDCVLQSGRDPDERLGLLGCYFALQFLLINIRSIDMLRLNVTEGERRISVYRDFLRRTGDDYSRLIREYIRRLLRIFLSGGPRPEFLVCAVGTRIHQDDVDLGIIDDGSPAREALNQAIGRMATEMLRWASAPDFYLSEHVGGRGYTVSIDEYARRLDERILDFVSVTEILGAQPLVGSRRLFERFEREIHDRYYYRPEVLSREHEGYLRGLLGEINSLLWWPQARNTIAPKQDLLRPVTAILWAYRTMLGIRDVGTWKALSRISSALRRNREQFRRLERSYTFVETVRHLYQQFAAQEEEIDLGDADTRANLQQVAEAMGYEDTGVVAAWEHLLVHYHEHVRVGRTMVRGLMPAVARHVRRCTVFAPIVRRRLVERRAGHAPRENFAEAILRAHEYFSGIKYWADLLEAMEDPDQPLLDVLVEDIESLDADRRRRVIDGFADWASQTFVTALHLLALIGRRRRDPRFRRLFEQLNDAFLSRLTGGPDEIRRFATVFVHNPAMVHEYLTLADDDDRRRFQEVLSGPVYGEELALWRERLRTLTGIHVHGSHYFRNAVGRVCAERPEFLLQLGELDVLDKIATGQLAEAMRLSSPASQKKALGTYYDVEFVRAGLATFAGHPPAEVDAAFSTVCDHYLENLFDICKSELDREQGRRILTHDRLGLFVSGGHARGRAFQDDWDLILLLFAETDELLDYSNRIAARMNREIARRGLMPQYHFADRFGRYVTPRHELERLLEPARDEVFVEMCQLLGARMIVGSGRTAAEFHDRILERLIFSERDFFIDAAVREMRSRHAFREAKGGWDADTDIKECHGGLRDLELLMLMWKVHDRALDPISEGFWGTLIERHPEHRAAFEALHDASQFLNRLRDVYRLTVAPVNRFDPAELGRVARLMGFADGPDEEASRRVADEFTRQRRVVIENCERLITALRG
ncbi:MAG: hypothetical protein D6738_12915 [Acidobacteria bacterium]|nr:MAG: hypothetical protein D6738_12915 [Acidobacteriota bacterium]